MEIIFCDVIGCSSPANRFLSDGDPPTERLCSYHWARLSADAPDRAELFVPIETHVEAVVAGAPLAQAAGEREPAQQPEPIASHRGPSHPRGRDRRGESEEASELFGVPGR